MAEENNSTYEPGIWLSIKDLAERKGVSKQAMSQRIKSLVDAGKIEVRQNGRFREVELVAFDRAVGQVGNALREQAAETRRTEAAGATSAMRDAQTDRAVYDARMKRLDFEERTGNLVPVRGPHGVEEALLKTSELILRELDSPLKSTQELFEAALIGEKELRQVMRKVVTDMRKSIAEKLAEIALNAENAGPFEIDLRAGDD